MIERLRDLIYITFLILMIVIPSTSSYGMDAADYSLRGLIAEEAGGQDASAREKMMLDYGTSVNEKNEVSLRDFRGGDDPASRAVGRGKAGLILHLLRRAIGEEAFSRAAGKILEKPPTAPLSWDDARAVFEKEAGADLGWFFQQWVDRKGLPDLLAENASVRRNGSRFEVSFDLIQKSEVYILDVPVVVLREQGRGQLAHLQGRDEEALAAAKVAEQTIIESNLLDPDTLAEWRRDAVAQVDEAVATAQKEAVPEGDKEDWCALSNRALVDHVDDE